MPLTEFLSTPLPERSLYPFPIKVTVYRYHVRCQVGSALHFLNRHASLLDIGMRVERVLHNTWIDCLAC